MGWKQIGDITGKGDKYSPIYYVFHVDNNETQKQLRRFISQQLTGEREKRKYGCACLLVREGRFIQDI